MPDWKPEIRKRIADLKLEPTREAEIVDELAQHMDDRYEEALSTGATREEALRAALAEMNDAQPLEQEPLEQGLRRIEKQAEREIVAPASGSRNPLAGLWQDARYGLRMLAKNRGFTLVATLTLALGIGANTAIFSVLNAALLRSLPYENADELAMFYFTDARGEQEWIFSSAAYADLKNQSSAFTDVAAWGNSAWPANLTGRGEPERLQGFQVSANFFETLGVAAQQGRAFSDEEDRPGNNRVAVISYDLWQRQFGGDPQIIGQPLMLNDAPYNCIGVMPADFRFILKTDIWIPLALASAGQKNGDKVDLNQVARLKPGVSREQARAEIENILRPYLSNPSSEMRAELKPLQTVLMGDASEMLYILFAAVGLVLLIACANVANLLLARASIRRRELAIRAALGAGRLRIARQLLVESALLAFAGGACGLILANWAIQFLATGLPEWMAAKNSRIAMLRLDWRALGFTLALSLLTIIIFGLVPALQAARVNLNEALKDGGRGESRGQNRLRSLLVVAEVAMATTLLIGAGLMIKSLWRLNNAHRGFEPSGALTAKIDPAGDRYREPREIVAFYQRLLERVAAIPGAQYAGITNGFLDRGWRISIKEQPPVPAEERPLASRRPVSEDYFRAMGIPLRAGRFFTDRDADGALPVAIIDETLARRHFRNEDPIGKHLEFEDALREVVGVVGATKAWKPYSFGVDEEFPQVYLPYQQEKSWSTMSLIVRAQSGDPMNLVSAIRRELAAIDKDQPIYSFKSLAQSVAGLSDDRRFSTMLLAAFAGLAALLAAVGIYGVMSYSVAERTREIGVRMALGAQPADVLKAVMARGMALVAIGAAIGLGVSLALARFISGLLFGVGAIDALTLIAITALLGIVGLAACLIPARRATKVDPMAALRCE